MVVNYEDYQIKYDEVIVNNWLDNNFAFIIHKNHNTGKVVINLMHSRCILIDDENPHISEAQEL